MKSSFPSLGRRVSAHNENAYWLVEILDSSHSSVRYATSRKKKEHIPLYRTFFETAAHSAPDGEFRKRKHEGYCGDLLEVSTPHIASEGRIWNKTLSSCGVILEEERT
jgi:hypothetical protein